MLQSWNFFSLKEYKKLSCLKSRKIIFKNLKKVNVKILSTVAKLNAISLDIDNLKNNNDTALKILNLKQFKGY